MDPVRPQGKLTLNKQLKLEANSRVLTIYLPFKSLLESLTFTALLHLGLIVFFWIIVFVQIFPSLVNYWLHLSNSDCKENSLLRDCLLLNPLRLSPYNVFLELFMFVPNNLVRTYRWTLFPFYLIFFCFGFCLVGYCLILCHKSSCVYFYDWDGRLRGDILARKIFFPWLLSSGFKNIL